MENLKTIRLSKIASVQTGPFGSQLHKEDYVDLGTPIITVEHLGGFKIGRENLPNVSAADKDRLRKYTLHEGDTVFSRVGSVDRCSYVTNEEDGWLFSGRCLRLRVQDDETDPRFLYYALTTPEAKEFIRAIAVGATMPSINTQIMGEVEIPDFPLPIQIGIADVLGSLDDKIAANNQIVRCSIELCSALIDATIGGGTVPLSDVAEVNMGTSPKGEFLNETGDGKPFFQGVRDFGKLFPSNRVFTQNAVRVANSGDILFAVRAPIGQVNIANEDCAIGRGVAAIRGKEHHLTLFYLLLSHQEIWDIFQDNGTVFASINRADLNGAPIPWPSDPARTEKTIAPIHARAMEALRENEVLARIRDELLPLLMSGRITVAGASESGVGNGVEELSEGMS